MLLPFGKAVQAGHYNAKDIYKVSLYLPGRKAIYSRLDTKPAKRFGWVVVSANIDTFLLQSHYLQLVFIAPRCEGALSPAVDNSMPGNGCSAWEVLEDIADIASMPWSPCQFGNHAITADVPLWYACKRLKNGVSCFVVSHAGRLRQIVYSLKYRMSPSYQANSARDNVLFHRHTKQGRPMRFLFLCFLIVPIIEMLVLIEVGSIIGGFYTVLLVLLTAAIGVTLLKRQGLRALLSANEKMQAGQMPVAEIAEGMMLAIAGALLLTPGFVTDAVGFLLLSPGPRNALARRWIKSFANNAHTNFQYTQTQYSNFSDYQSAPTPASSADPSEGERIAGETTIIEGEYRELSDEAKPDKK